MGSDIKNDAAAAEARRQAAEEARRRAQEEAARKAAAAAAQRAQAQAKAKTQAKPKGFGPDELSSGQGGALRRAAVGRLASTGLPTAATSAAPTSAPTFKLSALLSNLKQPQGATPPATDGYDQIEQARAQRAQDQAVDQATQGLPADQAQKVKDAAKVVQAAGQGVSDPGQRAQATAQAIQQQAAQFKGDPAAAKAFVQAVAPQVQGIGQDLSGAITTPLHGDSDQYTQPTLAALAKASDDLGAGAGMDLGHILSDGVPNTGDLNHFDDALGDLGQQSDGGRALLFGVAHGFQAQGKNDSYGNLQDDLRASMMGVSPGDVLQPVDPKESDAVGQARLKLEEAKYADPGIGGEDPNDLYASALQSQMGALKDDPAARQALAQSQTANIEDLAKSSALTGWRLATALDAAQAAGGGELDKIANQYAQTLGQTNVDLRDVASSVSPEAAKSLAFAFAKVGNTEMAGTFASRAADMLDGVAGAAKDANDEVADLQKKLDQQLSKVGPALTDAQKHDYEMKYWDEHRDALDQQKSANAALQGALDTDLGGLQQLAAISPDAAKSVSSCLKELARDPSQAQYVSDTVEGLKQPDGSFPTGFQDSEKDLVEADTVATQTLANQKLTEGDAEGAAEQLEKLHSFLENTTFATKDVREFVTQSLPALKDFTSVVVDAAKTKDFSKIAAYLKDPDKVEALKKAGESGGELGNLIGDVTKSVGVAAYIAGAASAKDGKEQLLDILHASQDSAELLADGFKAFSAATRDATNVALRTAGAGTEELAKVLEKVNPVLALGVSVVQDAASIADALNDPSVKTIGAAVGDTMTAVGSAVALFPGGELIGGGLVIAGAAVSLVSGFVQGILDDNARKDEEKKLLCGGLPGLRRPAGRPAPRHHRSAAGRRGGAHRQHRRQPRRPGEGRPADPRAAGAAGDQDAGDGRELLPRVQRHRAAERPEGPGAGRLDRPAEGPRLRADGLDEREGHGQPGGVGRAAGQRRGDAEGPHRAGLRRLLPPALPGAVRPAGARPARGSRAAAVAGKSSLRRGCALVSGAIFCRVRGP